MVGDQFDMARGTYSFNLLLSIFRLAMRIVASSAPQFPGGSTRTLAFGELFDLADRNNLMIVATDKHISGKSLFRWVTRMEVVPVFSRIQDAAGCLQMTLFANAVALRPFKSCRVHDVVFSGLSDVLLA